jgi:hypothetical protein
VLVALAQAALLHEENKEQGVKKYDAALAGRLEMAAQASISQPSMKDAIAYECDGFYPAESVPSDGVCSVCCVRYSFTCWVRPTNQSVLPAVHHRSPTANAAVMLCRQSSLRSASVPASTSLCRQFWSMGLW